MSQELHEAVSTNNFQEVRTLLKAEKDINSLENARLSVLGFYLQHGEDVQIEMVKLLVASGAGVDDIGDGCCALIPAMNGRTWTDDLESNIFVFLLKSGANPNFNQGTPLRWAVQSAAPQFVAYLLKHGADPKLANDDGVTAEKLGLSSKKPAIRALFESQE